MFLEAISAVTLSTGLSLAADTANTDDCTTLMNSTIASAHKPYTATSTTSGGGAPTRLSHSVSIGGKLFVEMNGRWILSKMRMSDMANRMQSEIKTAKMSCRRLAEGNVGGEAATIYSNHVENRGNVSDNTLWISKATGLPLRTEVKLKNGLDIVTVFDYSHFQVPEKYTKQP
jgi:hypothetical protein